MTLWARLTWQVPDPAAFAAELAARLATDAREEGSVPGGYVLGLAGGVLDIRPWVRESATDTPRPGGRLMLEPMPGGEELPEDAGPRGATLALAGVGWATVELDRAEAELGPWVGEARVEPPADDHHLGARARVRAGGTLPGEHVVFLEPSTEGRLAASLARDGEGPCAVYLRPAAGVAAWSRDARLRGVRLSARRAGPLGTAVLVLGGPVAGPHLLLVDAPPVANRASAASTIDP